jgi:hypothetical protein
LQISKIYERERKKLSGHQISNILISNKLKIVVLFLNRFFYAYYLMKYFYLHISFQAENKYFYAVYMGNKYCMCTLILSTVVSLAPAVNTCSQSTALKQAG